MSVIPLTKGRQTAVDYDDYDALRQIGSWCFSNSGYAVHYSKDVNGKRITLYMHRLVIQRSFGKPIPPDLQVDHIDQDRLNNRRTNLRFAYRNQNQAHKGVPINNTSGYKGVSWHAGKYETRIKFFERRIYLGRYDDPLTAALVYDAASRFLYREFAGCNFSDPVTPPHIAALVRPFLAGYGF